MIALLPRFLVLGAVWLVLAVPTLTRAAARGTDELDALVADYEAYNLPIPPGQAELSTLKWSTCTINGVPQYSRALAFVVASENDGEPARYWSGCRQRSVGREIVVTPAEPSPESLASTEPIEPYSEYGFTADPDLALAVQCAMRGWDDLAKELVARSRRGFREPFGRRRTRPRDDHAALADMAWNYWCEEFALEGGDRSRIVQRLRQLHEGPHGLNTSAHRNIIEDMQRTLAPTASPPESIERLIDSFVELGFQNASRDRQFATLHSALRGDSNYVKLQAIGLEAVPALLKHTHDFRMTRCIETDDRGVWHARIADVVRELFNGLATEEFAYDFLIREGRSKCVDRAHVLNWWSETRRIEARE